MADVYGLRTKDVSGMVTLDTTVSSIRSVKMLAVTGNGDYNQYFSIPEITANSFVVVDALSTNGGWSPQAFWSDGLLHLRSAGRQTWQVMILSKGGEPFNAAVTYGLRSRNNNVLTQIDAVNRVLTARWGGSFEFGMYWRPGMRAQISPSFRFTFPEVIRTVERPMVFLNSEDYMMVAGFRVDGVPGHWTGWGISHVSGYYREHGLDVSDYMKMKWFLATYEENLPAAGYGVVIKGGGGEKLFSSTDNLASLSSQPSNNSFFADGEGFGGGAVYQASSRMPWVGNFDDYVLANALFSHTNIEQTENPIIVNWGGFLPGNRNILKMYAQNYAGSPATGVSANGRTLFAARPMKPL